ncbi:hypothetical protein, partial [Actinotignum timonense]|uniref:hypothetical protein n=1 Tax=Actinotignum timonense TaxID=1870995 RepID=UPI00254FC37B
MFHHDLHGSCAESVARRRGPECGTTTPLPAALPSRYRRLDPHRVLRVIEIAAHRAGFVGNNAIN